MNFYYKAYLRVQNKIIICLILLLSSCHKDDNVSNNYVSTPIGVFILKADLHLHTYYSDGSISPEERVDEAIFEGFDVIAISDHIEYRPFIDKYPGDHNLSYQIAKNAANNRIIVIPGAEITRGMPPGHINALFIKDANLLDKNELWDVLLEAKKQNAYLIWNHPGWEMQLINNHVQWHDYHTNMLNFKLLNGIEIANHKTFYKEALKWAEEKKLSIFANSDLHSKSSQTFHNNNNFARPYTLIISKEKTIESVREALNKNQTIAFFNDMFFCLNKDVANFFINQSIQIIKQDDLYQLTNKSKYVFTIINSISKDTTMLYQHDVKYFNSNAIYYIDNFINGEKGKYFLDFNVISNAFTNSK